MLIISNAMPKSASSLLLWYTTQLLANAFPSTGQKALGQLISNREIEGSGEFVTKLNEEAMLRLLDLSEKEGPVVIKTHHRLTPLLKLLLRSSDKIKATFIHRDPRDMILSAVDHHMRSGQEAQPAFQEWSSVSESIEAARWCCYMSCEWVESNVACIFRYTDLIRTTMKELIRLCTYLGISVDNSTLEKIIVTERTGRSPGWNQFNRGALSRYPLEMNPQEIEICNRELGSYIHKLGYIVDDSTQRK